MQKNNKRLSDFFNAELVYRTEDRGVEIERENDGTYTVYARLYKTRIVRKEGISGKISIRTGGWNTQTTTKAINACIPAGWEMYRGKLLTPKSNSISLKENDWTELVEPEWYIKYVHRIY